MVAALKPVARVSAHDLPDADHVSVSADDSDDRGRGSHHAGQFDSLCILCRRHSSLRAHPDGRPGPGGVDNVGRTRNLYYLRFYRHFLSVVAPRLSGRAPHKPRADPETHYLRNPSSINLVRRTASTQASLAAPRCGFVVEVVASSFFDA